MARCQGAAKGSRDEDSCYGGSTSAYRTKSASEPSVNLAPRLDRREQNLPGVQIHCSIFVDHDKSRVIVVDSAVVFSKAVNGLSVRPIPKHVIAAPLAGRQLGVGGVRRPAGVIGPVPAGSSVGGSNSSVIGNGVANEPQRQLRRQRRA